MINLIDKEITQEQFKLFMENTDNAEIMARIDAWKGGGCLRLLNSSCECDGNKTASVVIKPGVTNTYKSSESRNCKR